jgi:hypothetical protein
MLAPGGEEGVSVGQPATKAGGPGAGARPERGAEALSIFGWILTNGLAAFLAWLLWGLLAAGTDHHLEPGDTIVIAILISVLLGVIGGPIQWRLMRRSASSAWGRKTTIPEWILASVAAGIAGPVILGGTGVLNLVNSDIHPALRAIVGGGILGALFGIAQMLALLRRFEFAGWWPAVSIAAWVVGYACLDLTVVSEAETGTAMIGLLVVPGALTGVAMRWILRCPVASV